MSVLVFFIFFQNRPPWRLKKLYRFHQAANSWQLWPEDLYDRSKGEEWRVFPFLHTFPAYDKSKMEWVGPNCKQCPETVKLLKSLPGIRTALYVVFERGLNSCFRMLVLEC